MNTTHLLTLLLAVAIGGIITVVTAYLLVKSDIQNYFRFKTLAHQKEYSATLFQLRLQAYERMIVFLDRINPTNLLVRLHQQGIGVSALQSILLDEIKAEYQHNITQQLYIDTVSWDIVRKLKDDSVAMINNAAHALPDPSSGVDLSKKILNHLSDLTENPYELAIAHLKADIQRMF